MIHLTHTVSGNEVGAQLAHDAEELALALVEIAAGKPDLAELLDYLDGEDAEAVSELCRAVAFALAEKKEPRP